MDNTQKYKKRLFCFYTIGTFCVFSIVFPLFYIIFTEDLLHSAI